MLNYQILAGICVNIITMSYGAFCGWPSASFLVLQSKDSPLESGPMSTTETAWVGAILCLGGTVGTVFFAWCADQIGRKRTLMLAALPSLIGWLIVPFATNPTHLCISRFLGGFTGGAAFAVIPVYTTEIAEDCMRGTLGTFLVMSANAGVLFAFILGSFLSYQMVAWIMSLLSIVFVVLFSFYPETPQYLMSQHKPEEAERSLRYYRNAYQELPENLKIELEKIKGDDKLQEQTNNDDVTWSDLNTPTVRKAFIIGLILMALNQFCGCFAMINYTATIFQQAGSNLPPNQAAIVVGFIQLCGSYVSMLLVERAGRKLLLTVSAMATGMGLLCLGSFSYYSQLGYDTSAIKWVPLFSFSFIIFAACWGVLSLPFLVVSEIMPPKLRNLGNMICMTILWIISFVVVKYFPIMIEELGMHGSMFTFAVCCFSGAIFILLFVPETKGKSIETILASL